MRPHLDDRRKLGAFYTPEALSLILARWAIQEKYDTVLEPSFGGCGLLAAARDVLASLGSVCPSKQIYGADIDPLAFDYLSSVFGSPTDLSGFIHGDFLECQDVESWPRKFSSILANPPYIPHHDIPSDKLQTLWADPGAIPGVKGRASMWAYFLSKGIKLLDAGGRMAWVLPGAFLQADYAEPIRAYLASWFERSVAIVVHDRLFLTEGADEETVILLCEGLRTTASKSNIEFGAVATIEELETRISDWDAGRWSGQTSTLNPATLHLTPASHRILETCLKSGVTKTLGSIGRVQIGLVTGRNSFFVLNQHQLDASCLQEEDCARVLSKFRAAPSLELTASDLTQYAESGGSVYLVDSRGRLPNARIEEYLDLFDAKERDQISTFKKRRVWSETSDGQVPDAFFPVMHHTGPRIVLNAGRTNCTNTIHRLFFLDDVSSSERMLAAISILTSYSQVSAELVGRRYGSGVLKHEPRDAERIALLLPKVHEKPLRACWRAIDALLRGHEVEAAMRAADEFIFSAAGIDMESSTVLSKALASMRESRRPRKRS